MKQHLSSLMKQLLKIYEAASFKLNEAIAQDIWSSIFQAPWSNVQESCISIFQATWRNCSRSINWSPSSQKKMALTLQHKALFLQEKLVKDSNNTQEGCRKTLQKKRRKFPIFCKGMPGDGCTTEHHLLHLGMNVGHYCCYQDYCWQARNLLLDSTPKYKKDMREAPNSSSPLADCGGA